MKKIFLTIALLCITIFGSAQIDTINRDFKRLDVFPAISYSPETNLTLGAIGYYYFDLTKKSPNTMLSNVRFLAAYTLAKQRLLELRWETFTDNNDWRFRGDLMFNRFPDRNYGLGNAANHQVLEIDGDVSDTLNYARFNSDRLTFAPILLKRIGSHTYLGLQGDLEYLYNFEPTADDYFPIGAAASEALSIPVSGLRLGVGVNFLLDNRDNIFNPLTGSYVEFSSLLYDQAWGSDFDFSSFRLDARHFIPVNERHTFAIRGVANLRFSEEAIPLRALSRVGGHDFVRGYFRGTFQDNHLLAFEMEYRWPFWKEDLDAPGWQIWKRLGIVGFVGGAQIFSEFSAFELNEFNLAAGAGLRILLNKESRINIRIDYGFGLAANSGGIGKRQSGLYFFLAEAF